MAKWRFDELAKIRRIHDSSTAVRPVVLTPFIKKIESRIANFKYRNNDPSEKKRLEARLSQLNHIQECVENDCFTVVGILGFHPDATSKDVPTDLCVSEVDSVVIQTKSGELMLISLYSNVENHGIYQHEYKRRYDYNEVVVDEIIKMASTFGVLYTPYNPEFNYTETMNNLTHNKLPCISTENPEFNFNQKTDSVFLYLQQRHLNFDIWLECSPDKVFKKYRIIKNDGIYDDREIAV